MGFVTLFAVLCLGPWGGIETDGLRALATAYPDFLTLSDAPTALHWRDGTELRYDDQRPKPDYDALLARACLKDQMSMAYPAGWPFAVPTVNQDPGRVRCQAFFKRMYGATESEVHRSLVKVEWLAGKTVTFSRVNGAANALSEVRREIGLLSPEVQRYAAKPVGTFSWRVIAGTERLSMHSFGAAIDLELPHACYRFWGWENGEKNAALAYPESILTDDKLRQIVCAFEKHGFIWGGKWYHYDTMHFEYRPELLPHS